MIIYKISTEHSLRVRKRVARSSVGSSERLNNWHLLLSLLAFTI